MLSENSRLKFTLLLLAQVLFISITHSSALAGLESIEIINPNNGHSYYLLSNQNWTDSESEAITLGGHLVTINDADENAWVLSTFSNYGGTTRSLWIGFNDIAVEGEWVWTSSEPVTYTNFSPGNPDNVNNEDYAYMIPPSGMWNDGQNGRWGTYDLYGVAEIVPEPATLLLLGLGVPILSGLRRKRCFFLTLGVSGV